LGGCGLRGGHGLLDRMFICYLIGLVLIVVARLT
jgi:hypothetical protein